RSNRRPDPQFCPRYFARTGVSSRQDTAWQPHSGSPSVILTTAWDLQVERKFRQEPAACAQCKPCYNRARLEKRTGAVKDKKTALRPSAIRSRSRVPPHEKCRQTLPENRRCGPPGWSLSLGHPLLGKPRPYPSPPHPEPVPSLHS